MKKLSTNAIRGMWLDFFKSKEHYFLEPVSLVPVEDPSLLWINSGVATLKPYFDGRKNPPAPRLTNSQKSIRTNDIENVGVTARHQTMFEMLGNFSIGDYFKKEAIEMAWELLTSEKWFGINKDLLYITVFEEDTDAYDIWVNTIKVAKDHIFKGTRETNFWDVGQGPCGPNTEIFFDRGEQWDLEKIGPRLLEEDIENDRYIEIWNIVFSQFNNDGANNYTELPRKNIDTGAGLERLASIFQNTPTNFETDLFWPTIKATEALCQNKFTYSLTNYNNPTEEQTKINTAFKVIADHVRAVTFAISDGVYPGNKDRGYIIRRLIRRSSVYGKKLDIHGAFLYKLVDAVVEAMQEFYPYIASKAQVVKEVIENEENRFLKTLSKGYEHLEALINKEQAVSAKNALLLFESFGFPIELTHEIALEHNVAVDLVGFEKLLEEAKELARNSRKDDKAWNKQSAILTSLAVESEFVGYDVDECDTQVNFMFENETPLQTAADQVVFLTIEKTPFYAEKGGQAADAGILVDENEQHHLVIDVQQGPNKQHIHKVQLKGTLAVGAKVTAKIDEEKRFYTMKNHSGTHILQAGIRAVLGESALQCGSYNNQDGLRLDITFNRMPTLEEIHKMHQSIEEHINQAIPREIIYCSLQDALEKHNALALFTEKYDAEVRVIKFGTYSCELCGGTHVANTKDIEDLLITEVESKGSGVYRFHAVTSHKEVEAYLSEQYNKQRNEIKLLVEKFEAYQTIKPDQTISQAINAINTLSVSKANLAELKLMVNNLKNDFKLYQKEVEDKILAEKLASFADVKPTKVNGINEIVISTNTLEMKDLKALADYFQGKYSDLVVKIANPELKVYVVSVSQSIAQTHKAIEIFKNTTEFAVKGGGNDTFAQGKIV